MTTVVRTDSALRHSLNGNQPARERLCLAILELDRKFTDIKPRRPEGGPDGGRDLEFLRSGLKGFGAVSFKNDADSDPSHKREIKEKFKADAESARKADRDVATFVFFCNIDLTPADVNELEEFAQSAGFTWVHIYYRETVRSILDRPDGLILRFQYLQLPLTEEEQQAFFSYYGSELENLVRGRLDRMEQSVQQTEFLVWKNSYLRKLSIELEFPKLIPSEVEIPEHFRVALELQGVYHEKRGFLIGARDEYHFSDDQCYHGKRVFFFSESRGTINSSSWLVQPVKVAGGYIGGINISVSWRPRSEILNWEFEDLRMRLHLTENLIDQITRIKFSLDEYEFLNDKVDPQIFNHTRPSLGWPDELTDSEKALEWRGADFWKLRFDKLPARKPDYINNPEG